MRDPHILGGEVVKLVFIGADWLAADLVWWVVSSKSSEGISGDPTKLYATSGRRSRKDTGSINSIGPILCAIWGV